MPLLLQLNGDLPEKLKGHERRLYIFGCNNRPCRRKQGSIRALRGTKINAVSSEKTSRQLAQKDEIRGNPFSASSNLGSSIFASTQVADTSSKPFSFSGSAPPALGRTYDPTPGGLATSFAAKASISLPTPALISREPWPPVSSFPKPYPCYHLDSDYEALEPTATHAPSSSSKMQIDQENTALGEDKDIFESSLDKTFQHFADRLAQNAEQVIRYEFGGAPLLYSKEDTVGKMLAPEYTQARTNSKITTQVSKRGNGMPPCSKCGKSRVFEFQLVPQAIAELEVDETRLDGMDWGTIIVGVCEGDCEERGIEQGEWGWIEEWVGVQWEEDSKAAKSK